MTVRLDRDLWNRIATIFDRALAVRATDRGALLDQLCGSDETIRREVEEMLEAHERSPGLIAERRLVTDHGSLGAADEAVAGSLVDGARVGPYRIVSPLGAGGMRAAALGVLTPGRGERLIAQHRFDRTVHTVVAVDAVEVPFHDVGDRVLLVDVQLPQARYGQVEEVSIDCGVRWCDGRIGLVLARGGNGERCDRGDDRARGHAQKVPRRGTARCTSGRSSRTGCGN